MKKPFFFFKSISYTASADTPFVLVSHPLWFRDANIHIETNDANYGDNAEQEATASAGGTLTFTDFNLADIWFKNAAAGSNTTIRAVGVLMSKGRKKSLEIMEGV